MTAPAMSRYAVPGRITVALDASGLDGPQVDEACGVAEPVVDLWEAGALLPTPAQVGLLSKLTGMTPGYFYEMDPIPAGRTFVCGRRKQDISVTERGELACPECGAVCWMRAPSNDGPVLLAGPDEVYGQLIVALLGKTRTTPRRLIWGVRPVGRGERAEPYLRRRPHECPAFAATCTVPSGPDGSECGELAKMFPGGLRCRIHAPSVGAGVSFPWNRPISG